MYSFQNKKDKDEDKEEKAKTLVKQIFEEHGYESINFLNPNDGTYYGVDGVILKDDIPLNDPLNLSILIQGRFSDTNYAIDCKSNNVNSKDPYDRGSKSIYIKLMNYRPMNPYLPYYTKSNGEIIETMTRYQIMDDKNRKKVVTDKRFKKKSWIEHYYGNHFLLGEDNKTDYFFYVKYDDLTLEKDSDKDYELVSAYLVPAEQLRNQVINILNSILKKGRYNHPIKLRQDNLHLNHKIRNALRIVEESPELIKPEILKPPMDLFVMDKHKHSPDKNDIILRIPEKFLTQHIKFDEKGVIIN